MKSGMWICISAVLLMVLGVINGQSLCNDVSSENGIDYRYHPSDCSQYIQCHTNDATGEKVAVFRKCPWGHYWNQLTKTCELQNLVSCPLERCVGANEFSTKIEGSGCRAYWRCSFGRNQAMCCEPGYRFVTERGCIADYTCMDPCPGACAEMDVCRYSPSWIASNNLMFVSRGQQLSRECPTRSEFDIMECGCVSSVRSVCNTPYLLNFEDARPNPVANWLETNVQQRNGAAEFNILSSFVANVQMTRATLDNPIMLRFRFRESSETFQIRNLLTSQDCAKCNLIQVDLVGTNLEVSIRRFLNTQALLSISLQGIAFGDWKNVLIVYNGRELIGVVRANTSTYMNRVQAPNLPLMDCGLSFGSNQNSPFTGQLDSFAVYNCIPGGRLMDLVV